jgi:uncharacterized protein (DUF2062 family)
VGLLCESMAVLLSIPFGSCPMWLIGVFTLFQREANVVAHNLARQAVLQRFSQVWIDAFPSCIAASVIAEQQVVSSHL